MKKELKKINATEKEYWNEGKLERSKIKKLRRHAFYYSYKREKIILDQLLKDFNGQKVLEIGSYSWAAWFNEDTKPKSLTCINISEKELEKGKQLGVEKDFHINHLLMDANNLTF